MSPPEKPLSDQSLPLEIAEPNVFAEPWQAQAFALVISLHEKDVFSWNEWADALSGTPADWKKYSFGPLR